MRHSILFAFLFMALLLLGLGMARAGEQPPSSDIVSGTVVSVYDGDTLTVRLPGLPAWLGETISVRVAGIDTPELRGTRPDIKALAYRARDLARGICPVGSPVVLSRIERGKYFRLVAGVQCRGGDLARELLEAGLAHEYDGTGRREW